MASSSAANTVEVTPDEPGLERPSHTQPSADEGVGAGNLPLRHRDRVDLLLVLFDRVGLIVPAVIVLALGAGVAYLGAICITTALLRRSAAAQEFFITLLATMLWSGYAILVFIGIGIAIFSSIQLTLWPRSWGWRWLARRLGLPMAWAATILWATTVVVEAFLVGWGFELWAWPHYIGLRAALGFAPTPDGLLLVSGLAAPVLALLPEWCARFGLAQLLRAWRGPSTL